MFLLWLFVIVALAVISGIVGFSNVPRPWALMGRGMFGILVVLGLVYLFFGAVTDFEGPFT